MKPSRTLAGWALLATGLVACGSTTTPAASSHAAPSSAQLSRPRSAAAEPAAGPVRIGTDQQVTFGVDGVVVHGSLRRPVGAAPPVPAAVLLAGSGPTDRNGDNPGLPGNIGTLSSLAQVLAQHGVASLRYDKLGTGATGISRFADHVAGLGYSDYVAEAQGALSFLAGRPGVDLHRLIFIGHSEGSLIALSAVIHPAAGQPVVAGLALLEGPGSRYLDLISAQLTAAIPKLVAAGTLPADSAAAVEKALAPAISTLRATGSLPANLPLFLQQQGLNNINAHFLFQADQADPVALAGALPAHLPVFTTCSTKDLQVSCAEVGKVNAALGRTDRTAVTLTEANHFLKDVAATPVASITDLRFSSELPAQLGAWLTSVR